MYTLSFLFRHRLKEGFRIARAQSGVVTLTAQLTVSQPHSSRDLAMLLQYVIFPLATNPSTSTSFSSITVAGGYPTCELWVEPQYGTVTHTPAGLHYTQGCTYDQIADKVRSKACKPHLKKFKCTFFTADVYVHPPNLLPLRLQFTSNKTHHSIHAAYYMYITYYGGFRGHAKRVCGR